MQETEIQSEIKFIRENLPDLTQEQLASIFSVTQATVARWENGKVSPPESTAYKIKQLAATLKVPADKGMIQKLLGQTGGLTTLCALLALGGAFLKSAPLIGVSSLFGPTGIAASAAIAAHKILCEILEKKKIAD